MLVVIDNYDSFTYNLVQYLGELGATLEVYRNDAIDAEAVRQRGPAGIVVSPGPCTPNEAGNSCQIIATLAGTIPILGVCLGHQAIGQVFGGVVEHAPEIMHGKTSMIHHRGTDVFQGLPNPFEATRYHSLVVSPRGLPEELEITAQTEQGIVMGLAHRQYPVYGVQFHPESILTNVGKDLLANFLKLCGETHAD